jgi:hypothetical protein
MEDNNRFSGAFLKAIALASYDGETMIAVSRAILRNSYTDGEYENEFFTIFILIDEESGDVVLDGFGEFNIASERYALEKSHIKNFIKIMIRMPKITEIRSNHRLLQDEIKDIAHSYHEQFLDSLGDFKAYFRLEEASRAAETKPR